MRRKCELRRMDHSGGFDVTPYMVDDHTALLNLNEKWKVMELKDFVLDPYFAQV